MHYRSDSLRDLRKIKTYVSQYRFPELHGFSKARNSWFGVDVSRWVRAERKDEKRMTHAHERIELCVVSAQKCHAIHRSNFNVSFPIDDA